MKIVHLTDLHLGIPACNAVFEKVATNIVNTLTPASDYVIVITGDLMDSVESIADYQPAIDAVNRFRNADFKVLVVPGNHDYGKGAHQYAHFVPAFKEAFYGTWDFTYPRKDVIDGVAFIGLDSMEAEVAGDAVWADGRLGEAQLTRLEKMLSNDITIRDASKRVLYLHHRPFDYMAVGHLLNDRDQLKTVVRDKVDVMLFGHKHKSKVFNRRWGIPKVYDGGTSTKKDGEYSPHMIIDLSSPVGDILADFY